ncbi:MAG: COX15/CtaA family protein [Burkholderiaceae bacterium]
MLIQLAATGLLVALLPAAIIWTSSDRDKYRKLAWVTLFLTFDLVMFGAFTRLTDSGLGCPDWPGCYGQANPLQAHDSIRAAEAAMPTGPVTVLKAWIEMTHRYVAMAVGVLIVAAMIIAWRNRIAARRHLAHPGEARFSPWLPTALFGFVCLQGAFGAWTVTMKLQPVIVTTHLLLGMTLLALLCWQALRLEAAAPVAAPGARRLAIPAAVGLVLLGLQIALGGWVSTNYATLACSDLPLCHGALVPEMDFANGFTLWRKLGQTGAGDFLPFSALTAIHWTHRVAAVVVAVYIGWLAVAAMRLPSLRKTGRRLLIAVILQVVIGASTVYLRWPLAIAVLHNGVAAILVLLTVVLNYRVRRAVTSSAVSRSQAHRADHGEMPIT